MLLPHIVGHLLGYDHRDFDQAGHGAGGVAPRCLVYHLAYALLLDGVAVRFARGEHMSDDGL